MSGPSRPFLVTLAVLCVIGDVLAVVDGYMTRLRLKRALRQAAASQHEAAVLRSALLDAQTR